MLRLQNHRKRNYLARRLFEKRRDLCAVDGVTILTLFTHGGIEVQEFYFLLETSSVPVPAGSRQMAIQRYELIGVDTYANAAEYHQHHHAISVPTSTGQTSTGEVKLQGMSYVPNMIW